MPCEISKVTVERYASTLGIQHATPRISWRFEGDAKNWKQQSYDMRIERNGKDEEYHVDTDQSTYVSWPSKGLQSR
jgi:alpha-L-rhamnosidase